MQSSYQKIFYQCLILLVPLFYVHSNLYAGEGVKSEFIYRSPEERREAGLKMNLTEWLSFSGLLEIERAKESLISTQAISDVDIDDDTETLQLAFEVEFSDNIQAVLVYELEKDENNKTHSLIEEAILIVEVDDIELEIGKQTVPFGEFYGHFISDPMLAFGEKLNDSIVLTYEANDLVDIALFAAEGSAAEAGGSTRDWGFNIELRNEDESIKIAIAYLSDLADTDEHLLSDFNNIYQNKVAAWNTNALFGFESFEITIEFVAALDSFVELDTEGNRPSAFNIELAYFPHPDIQLAVRAETSEELEDAPEKQYGISSTVVFAKTMTFSIEFLTGKFKPNFVLDDNDVPLKKIDTFALQLTYAF